MLQHSATAGEKCIWLKFAHLIASRKLTIANLENRPFNSNSPKYGAFHQFLDQQTNTNTFRKDNPMKKLLQLILLDIDIKKLLVWTKNQLYKVLQNAGALGWILNSRKLNLRLESFITLTIYYTMKSSNFTLALKLSFYHPCSNVVIDQLVHGISSQSFLCVLYI